MQFTPDAQIRDIKAGIYTHLSLAPKMTPLTESTLVLDKLEAAEIAAIRWILVLGVDSAPSAT